MQRLGVLYQGICSKPVDIPCDNGKYVLAEVAIAEIKKYRDFVTQLGKQLDMLDGAECACYDIDKFLHATSSTQKM